MHQHRKPLDTLAVIDDAFDVTSVSITCMKKSPDRSLIESLRSMSTMAIATLFLFAFSAVVVSAQLESIGNVLGSVQRTQNGVTFNTSSGAVVSAQLFNNEVVRIRINPTGQFERDHSYAFEMPPKPQRLVFSVTETPAK